MISDPFNAVGGLTVGIPPVSIVDSNGNVVTNIVALSGNVSANRVYSNYYYYANGLPFSSTPAGTNTYIQFNQNGVLGASSNLTFDYINNIFTTSTVNVTNSANLGNASNLKILGGSDGYFLQTDGTGNLTWAAGGGGGGNGSPGGANTQVQFNNAGTFGGTAGFTFNTSTNTLSVPTFVSSNITSSSTLVSTGTANFQLATNVNLGNVSNINISGGNLGYFLQTDGNGHLAWAAGGGGGNGTPGGINQDVQYNSSGTFAGNVAFTFNDTTLTLSVPNFLTTSITTTNITSNASGALTVLGNLNAGVSPNVFLGSVSNVKITGGADGYYLQTDGTGNLSWAAGGGGGGNGSPGGANTQVQFNNNGLFGGSPYMTFNTTTNTFNVAGNLIANALIIGSGVYQFSVCNVYFATTSTTTNTTLLSLPANNISGLDFTIVATNNTTANRQITKLSAVLYNASMNYNEYSSLFVGGQVGNFVISYNPGNIISPATAVLSVIPTASSLTVYKIQITQYEP
jgi:hypothetical protein